MITLPKAYQRSLLPYLLKHHSEDITQETLQILSLIYQFAPNDYFTISQWKIGLSYYRKRFETLSIQGDIMLDMGCGSGNWSLAATDYFQQVIGIDLNIQRLSLASHIKAVMGKENVNFVKGDISLLPLNPGGVDCVMVYNVIQLCQNWENILADIYRVLRTGGTLWIGYSELGILVFYLAQAFSMMKIQKLRDIIVVVSRILGNRLRNRSLAFNGAYLQTKRVIETLSYLGFTVRWRSWEDGFPVDIQPLLPTEFFGFPFFREMIITK